MPSRMYTVTAATPRRAPKAAARTSTANVCPVTGTGLNGSGISIRAASARSAVPKTTSATRHSAPSGTSVRRNGRTPAPPGSGVAVSSTRPPRPTMKRLVPAGRDSDLRLLVRGADHVRAAGLESVGGLLREIIPERAVAGLALEDVVRRRDRHRLVPAGLVDLTDAGRGRPDQRVDLVELPGHVALAERGGGLQDDVDAVRLVVAAEHPAFERGLQELRRDVLIT